MPSFIALPNWNKANRAAKVVVTAIEISKDGHIEIYETDRSAIPTSSPRIPNVHTRLFIVAGDTSLVEGLDSWISQDAQVRRSFIKAHLEDQEKLQWDLDGAKGDDVFFASWWRTEMQNQQQYEIRARIQKNKPHLLDTPIHLRNLQLPHTRYYHRWPDCPHRPYHVISPPTELQPGTHAALECMSYFFSQADGILTGVILEDPMRYHVIEDVSFDFWTTKEIRTTERIPCFLIDPDTKILKEGVGGDDKKDPLEEKRTPSKFVTALHKGAYCNPEGRLDTYIRETKLLVKTVIVNLISEDLSGVLHNITKGINVIELALHDDAVLQESMPIWREQLGRWRNALFHQSKSLARVVDLIDTVENRRTVSGDRLIRRMKLQGQDLDRASRRIETTFQALISSINIVESERAISEAESVSKLTNLAFFFIPLSLVSSVFGMNIKEFEGQLTWWHWTLVSVALSAATYAALYAKELQSVALQIPGRVLSSSIKGLSRLVVRGLRVLAITINNLPLAATITTVLACFAGLTVAAWRIINSSAVSMGVKVGVSPLVILLPVIVALSLGTKVAKRRSSRVRYRRVRDVIVVGMVVIAVLSGIGIGMMRLIARI